MTKKKVSKVVLAYSGGLDTSCIVPWLIENYDCEVVTFTADLGQEEELDGLQEKAKVSGAVKSYVEDLRQEFLTDFVFPTLKAGAIYERQYLLGTSFARPLIAKRLVEIAELEGRRRHRARLHRQGQRPGALRAGCDGAEPAPSGHRPLARVGHPLARGRAGVSRPRTASRSRVTGKSIYSRDRNIWHLSHEGHILENPWLEPEEDMFLLTVAPEAAPDTPRYVEIDFKAGIPVRVRRRGPRSRRAGDLSEQGGRRARRRPGRHRREPPGGHQVPRRLRDARRHACSTRRIRALETLCLDGDTLHYKDVVAEKYAEMVYYGKWFTPLREAMDAFVDSLRRTSPARVRLKLYKGQCTVVGSQVALLALPRGLCHLWRGRRLRPERRRGLYPPLWPAAQGAGAAGHRGPGQVQLRPARLRHVQAGLGIQSRET